MFSVIKRTVALLAISAPQLLFAVSLSEQSLRQADAEQMRIIVVTGHLKTSHSWSIENQPPERAVMEGV